MTYDFCPSPPTCNADPLGPSLADACNTPIFLTFMSLLNACVRNNEKISGSCERVRPIETPDKEYDFVVVGGGAAGSVVAARLSEICDWQILLLDAGPDEPAGAQIPAFGFKFLETDIIWDYKTTNESNACLATNRSCAWPSGKNLGGNTAHNGMVWLRGNPTDYNNWAEQGNERWSWEEVEPFFITIEDNAEIERVGRKHHGTGGPQSIERFRYLHPLGYAFLNASEEAGYGVSEDLNGDTLSGLSQVQTTSKNGIRQSTSRAFLWPIRNRKNLHVSLNSTVTRVIIENDRAVGVEYYKDGQLNRVHAAREVILSAGAVESPHLLLLSGIGPEDHLRSMNVDVMKGLPGVGKNLQDHAGTPIVFTLNDIDEYDNNWAYAFEYLASQTGPLSGLGTASVLGLLASNLTTPDYPDIQILFGGYIATCAPGEVDALASTGRRSMIIGPAYLHPKSRGSVTMASNDPFELPVIQANYMSEREDIDVTIQGVRMIQTLLDTEALRPYNFTLADPFVAACTDYEFDSDDFWECKIKQSNYALYHQGGTCKMGPASDPMAVVDPRLRVYGIRGLRVADTSIMPQIPSCNTAAPAMMIGERVADFIKKDWDREFGQGSCSHNMCSGNVPSNHDRTANYRETKEKLGCQLTARSNPKSDQSTGFNGI